MDIESAAYMAGYIQARIDILEEQMGALTDFPERVPELVAIVHELRYILLHTGQA